MGSLLGGGRSPTSPKLPFWWFTDSREKQGGWLKLSFSTHLFHYESLVLILTRYLYPYLSAPSQMLHICFYEWLCERNQLSQRILLKLIGSTSCMFYQTKQDKTIILGMNLWHMASWTRPDFFFFKSIRWCSLICLSWLGIHLFHCSYRILQVGFPARRRLWAWRRSLGFLWASPLPGEGTVAAACPFTSPVCSLLAACTEMAPSKEVQSSCDLLF